MYRIECYFCGCKKATIEDAIDADWVPSFYEPGEEHETLYPVCPVCQDLFLEEDEFGNLIQVADEPLDCKEPQCE